MPRSGIFYLTYFADGMCTPFLVSFAPLFPTAGLERRQFFVILHGGGGGSSIVKVLFKPSSLV